MNRNGASGKIERLLQRGAWTNARRALEQELRADPENHWLLTQLGVTHYEQREYERALELFLASRRLVADCPLTLWNVAGALDAVGKPAQAVRIYKRLLASETSSTADPCWESAEWSERLKADCLYRWGVCLEHQGKRRAAERRYRQYLDLLLAGMEASYTVADVTDCIRRLHAGNGREARSALRLAVAEVSKTSGRVG